MHLLNLNWSVQNFSVRLPLLRPQDTRSAPLTLVGYPPISACLIRILGTHKNAQRKILNEMHFGKAPMHCKACYLEVMVDVILLTIYLQGAVHTLTKEAWGWQK